MVTASVGGEIRLQAKGLDPRVHLHLHRGLSFPNPEYLNRQRFGWGGARVPAEITAMERDADGVLYLPRGAIALLQEAVALTGEALAIEDQRVIRPTLQLACVVALRPYQQIAAKALVQATQGYAVVPCGGGKTIIGAAAIARAGQPALVLVHTHDLLEQWRAVLRSALGAEAGVVAEGKANPAPLTVATVQTLAGMSRPALDELGRQFGTVVVDELHHVPAVTFRSVLSHLPGRYRFGLTATPERTDGLSPLLDLCLGRQVFRIGHQELVEAGHLIVPRVVAVHTGCRIEADTHSALVGALVEDAQRNALVVDLARREAGAGRSVLVLSGRVEHCNTVAGLLQARGVDAQVLTSAVPKAKRNEILDRFRAGTTRVVCATSLADEGLDVSRLERLVLATPARAEGRTVQRLGRLMRSHPGKAQPVLFDLVDADGLSRSQFQARQRAYRKALGPVQVDSMCPEVRTP